MKKDVFITICGVQKIDSERDTTELYTQGSFYKRNNHYYISYDESDATGFADSKTTLRVEGSDRVTMIRSGASRSHLVVERGSRNIGLYGTAAGELSIGVYAHTVESKLTDDGGDLFFSYSLDLNSSLLSENEIKINVRI